MVLSEPIAVSALVQQVKTHLEPAFRSVWVQGELTGVKHHPSGHWYFALKDDQAQLRAVMFRSQAARLAFPLEDGQTVAVRGRLGVYDRDGQTQLYADTVDPIGAGAQRLALEALYRRLQAEGLFDRPKRTWPLIPACVVMITAESGAARRDIEAVARRRCPGIPVELIPAAVQGAQAPESLVNALSHVDPARHTVVILGRGGGATEDLQAFNAEAVVRAVAACPVPVISAVGHEIDTTLTDLAADMRAPTPSAAAELAIPDVAALQQTVIQMGSRWHNAWAAYRHRRLDEYHRAVDHPLLRQPALLAQGYRERWERTVERWDRAWMTWADRRRHDTAMARARLQALDPTAILGRGYAYVTDASGQVVTAASAPAQVFVHWADGTRQYQEEA
ncbi:exodeoxyribonuclease VII large subunit [Sulfobacillus thermosulfidooxidans]|uniref:exodeoxyribonuclease VII large subunit n=1 Tax=Sulfobacillus thermosulfidooxidans TaxID=28034 RepID=UPI000314C6A3|nr:exodeoxyribonuclease VII large subunit [Sulfobacillus thermosulfidooxidans]